MGSNSEKYPQMVECIRKELGATMLKNRTLDGMIQGLVLSRKKLCLHCWLGSRSVIGRKGPITEYTTLWYTYADFSGKSFPMVEGMGPSLWNGQKDGKPFSKNRNWFAIGHYWQNFSVGYRP